MALTPKQQRFAEEYLADLNATQAAVRAGYSPRAASSQGERLLRNAEVRAAVAAGQEARSKRLEVSQDWVVGRLTAEAQEQGEGASHGARVKALELLGKHVGMWPNKLQIDARVAAKLTLEQALAADKELEEWQRTQGAS